MCVLSVRSTIDEKGDLKQIYDRLHFDSSGNRDRTERDIQPTEEELSGLIYTDSSTCPIPR